MKCPKCQTNNPDTLKFCGECGTPLTSPEDISLSATKTMVSPVAEGSTVAGKYKIIEKLGEGGMGVVYKAEDTSLDRKVALKFLPQDLMRESSAKERFIREAKAAAALSHPNICTVHEIGEQEETSFIAMEYIEGESLRERTKKGPFDLLEALDIAIQAAQGLEEAHKRGIIHRDIKSANIMVTEKGQAKVMDFGIAKVSGATMITREAATMGTVAYMSPEQAEGKVVDSRTDIWSLGVVLFEMITGQLPFSGENDQSMMYSIVHKSPEPMRKAVPKVSPELERVVGKALEKNLADRYQTMGELLEDLRALAEGMKPLRAKARLLRGRILGIRSLYFYAGLVVVMAVIIIGIVAVFPGRSDVIDSVAILPIINDSGDPNQDYFANSLTTLMISELYKVAALTVAPREAVMPYKNSTKSLKEKAKELKVKSLVEASVLKSGDRVRLTASLIDPYRNRIIWSDTLEKDYSEILILQSELSQAIVSGINVAITRDEKTRLVADQKVNPEAYDLVMQGVDFWLNPASLEEMSGEDVNRKTIDYFQRAIDIDPTFALAHAWKAHIYSVLGLNSFADEREVYPKAKEAVLKALELDENLAQAHATLGVIKLWMDWDFTGAEIEYKKAFELEPGNELMWIFYEMFLITVGRGDEALAMYKRWIEKQEESRYKEQHARFIALYYLWIGRYEEALEEYKNRISTNPDQHFSFYHEIAVAYALNDMYSEALLQIDKIKNLPDLQEDILFRLNYAWVLAVSGRREESLKELERLRTLLSQRNIDTAYYTACIYAGLGDKDKAFEYLNQAYENHFTLIVNFPTEAYFRSLHDDPRFEELKKKVGFPSELKRE